MEQNKKIFTVNPFDKIDLDKTNVYFISDFHIGHYNVIKFDNRPFENLGQMHQTIIDRWNSVVGENDIVYYLGDLLYRTQAKKVKHLVHKLKGDIKVILGNHDRLTQLIKMDRFSDIQSYKRLEIISENKKYDFILFHYPILSWDKSYHGSIHIHGHTHGNLMKTDIGKNFYYNKKVIDVACNVIDYTPISFKQVLEKVKNNEKEK